MTAYCCSLFPSSTPLTLGERIQQYWTQRAASFRQVRQRELHSDKPERWWAEIAPHLPARKRGEPLRVLDVGTGAGFLAILFARQGCEVTAVDSCAQMLREAEHLSRNEALRIDFRQMDADRLQFANDSFDCGRWLPPVPLTGNGGVSCAREADYSTLMPITEPWILPILPMREVSMPMPISIPSFCAKASASGRHCRSATKIDRVGTCLPWKR